MPSRTPPPDTRQDGATGSLPMDLGSSVPSHRDVEVARPPWWRRLGPLVSVAVLAFLVLLPLRGLLRLQGSPMEEGFMLVFPERVLEGDLPNRDFLHLYGPGSLWALAGAFKVFGISLLTERLVGLAQILGLTAAVYALARPWGRALATTGAVVCLFVIVPPIGLTALAWNGAMALGVWAVWAALRSRHAPAATAGRWAVAAGVLAGLALLYRPDLVVATSAGVVAALWGVDRLRRTRFAVGLGLGLAPYVIHFLTAGIVTAFRGMVFDPVFLLRGGRSLPIPPSFSRLDGFLQLSGETYLLPWPLPTPTTAQQIFIWFWMVFAVNAALLGVAVWRVRTDPSSVRGRILLATAAFSIGLLPQAVQRTDSTHFAWTTAIALGLLPVVVLELLDRSRTGWRPGLRTAVASASVLLLLLVAIPTFTYRRYTDLAVQSFGYHRLSFEVTHEGRNFYSGRRDAARALRDLLPDVEEVSSPGDRLFVGTGDLRFTPYSDAFLYHLLPDLEPATQYIEMDPGVANREGSGLAEDLASADVVILSRIWDDWNEPNDSREVGSDEPNQVLAEQFRRIGVYGDPYELYELWVPLDLDL